MRHIHFDLGPNICRSSDLFYCSKLIALVTGFTDLGVRFTIQTINVNINHFNIAKLVKVVQYIHAV